MFYVYLYKFSFTFVKLYLNIIIHQDGVGGLQKIYHLYHMWYGVQNMSKYDINIKVQPLGI